MSIAWWHKFPAPTGFMAFHGQPEHARHQRFAASRGTIS
jgi:hypothetical protein